jgi:membrane protein
MELIKKSLRTKIKQFFSKIAEDDLFLLSSSVSYYSALALAPFLLILLGVASLIGGDVQSRIIELAFYFSSELGKMVQIIFSNVNEGVNIGSTSGIIGIIVLLWTSSLVFLQLRYALNVIYNFHDPSAPISIWLSVKERLFAMFVVIMAGIFLIFSSLLPGTVQFFFGTHENLMIYKAFAVVLNFLVYIMMFLSIHSFVPSKRPKNSEAFKMALLSTVFFILGNTLLTSYLKEVAIGSIYGAAGSLLVFLTWAYYSSFTLFLSVELFLYLRKMGKSK